jgi:hypothetical protein
MPVIAGGYVCRSSRWAPPVSNHAFPPGRNSGAGRGGPAQSVGGTGPQLRPLNGQRGPVSIGATPATSSGHAVDPPAGADCGAVEQLDQVALHVGDERHHDPGLR